MTTDQSPSLSQLPDYPQIKKLASALHRLDASRHGAAIMIGAGFSRSAAVHVGGSKRVPLWGQFTNRLAERLYPGRSTKFVDPLRVAEEFRAYFGQAVLNDQIRFEIEDEAWKNGPLYKALLSLPWTDVLTTNWDTLLERAAADLSSPYYTTVTKCSDLAWAPSPRVVKLHGTIGVTDVLIAAQEDYRRYPDAFAPFVNMARQVFIENELCLLGFSGDDPNFLAWAGWVRDHLADHARKIYLVGALDLPAARRTHLESMNIAPVDLGPAVAHIADLDLKHQRATELFLTALSDELKSRVSPHDWRPQRIQQDQLTGPEDIRRRNLPEVGAPLLASQLNLLKETRESYPGWLVCPPAIRWNLANQASNPHPSKAILEALKPEDRAKMLYELCWRRTVTLTRIEPWLADMLLPISDPAVPSAISCRQQIEIALALLSDSRWRSAETANDRREVDQLSLQLVVSIEKFGEYLPDLAAEVAYHRALVLRDRIDYAGLAEAVDKVTGSDPVWMLRKASLVAELGRTDEAAELIARAYGDLLKSHRSDRHSIPVLSRLVWAHWLLQAVQSVKFNAVKEELPSFAEQNYRLWRCDPWVSFEDFRAKLAKRFETHVDQRVPMEVLFPQGQYREHHLDDSSANKHEELHLIDSIACVVGIPIRLGSGVGISILSDDIKRVIVTGGTGEQLRDGVWAIRTASSEGSVSIKDYFTRVGVARSAAEVVNLLVERVQSAIDYWRKVRLRGAVDESGSSLKRLSVLFEVLSRLVVRLPPATSIEIFRFAAALAEEPDMQHGWVVESLGRLVENSLMSVPRDEQVQLLPEALRFPLASELNGSSHREWANPVIHSLNGRDAYPSIDTRIAQLIEAISSSDGRLRLYPLLRLLPLNAQSGFLGESERIRLSQAVWGVSPDFSRLPETGLLPHAYLELPSEDKKSVEELVRRELFCFQPAMLADTQKELRRYPSPELHRATNWCESISSAALDERLQLHPTPEQALILFDELAKWRPAVHTGALSLGNQPEHLGAAIGRALSNSIAPSLSTFERDAARFEAVLSFYEEVEGATSALPALTAFSHLGGTVATAIVRRLTRAVLALDQTSVFYASIAIWKWTKLVRPGSLKELDALVALVLAFVESNSSTALHQLIWVATKLAQDGWLSEAQLAALNERLPSIFESVAYEKIGPNAPVVINASTIRSACVTLAKTLLESFPEHIGLAQIVVAAREDALPEVRFAEFEER